jgi:hypothetical protein
MSFPQSLPKESGGHVQDYLTTTALSINHIRYHRNMTRGLAKKMLLVESRAYRQQYGFTRFHSEDRPRGGIEKDD